MDDETAGPAGHDTLRLRDFLPYRLSVLSNTLSRRIADIYEAEHGLTIWQWRVMAVLGESEGLTASAIMQRTAMDKVAVSRAVAGLEKAGRLTRAPSRQDGRASALRLTPAGRAVYEAVIPRARAIEAGLLSDFTASERAALSGLLDRLAARLSPDRPLWDSPRQ